MEQPTITREEDPADQRRILATAKRAQAEEGRTHQTNGRVFENRIQKTYRSRAGIN